MTFDPAVHKSPQEQKDRADEQSVRDDQQFGQIQDANHGNAEVEQKVGQHQQRDDVIGFVITLVAAQLDELNDGSTHQRKAVKGQENT